MSYCRKCGTQIDETAKFCHSCGEPQIIDTVVSSNETVANENVVTVQQNAPVDKKKMIIAKAKEYFSIALAFVKKHPKKFLIGAAALVVVIVIISIYNATHCDYSGCNNSSVSGSDYCYSHKCNMCSSAKAYNSNYCYFHKTLYDSSSSTTTTSSATSDLKFSNVKITHNSLYTVVTGTVTNNGSRSYKFVTVKGAFKTSSGTVVDTDSTYAVGREGLASGESTTFRMSIDKNTSVTKCDISIISYK
mgnify:CR=1 FL=1